MNQRSSGSRSLPERLRSVNGCGRMNTAIVDSVVEACAMFLEGEVAADHGPDASGAHGGDTCGKEVIAFVGFAGGLHGRMGLVASEESAAALAGALAGERFDRFEGDAVDGFGEIANLVCGGVSTRLAENHGEIRITPPRVMSWSDFHSEFGAVSEQTVRNFNAETGPFRVVYFPEG